MSTLLAKAYAQLESSGPYSLRRACWLARAALEGLVMDRLLAKGIDAANASERAKITCLEGAYADDSDFVFRVEYAWNRLSDACHQHAYQLAPTYIEVGHLLGLVEALATR